MQDVLHTYLHEQFTKNKEPLPDLTIRVDFFKPSGKWAYGGEVNVGQARLWKGDIPQAVVDNQNIIYDGWQDRAEYLVVTRDTAENWAKEDYHEFNLHLFKPEKFVGLKRRDS